MLAARCRRQSACRGRTRSNTIARRGKTKTSGGARRDRTDDLLLAKQALSQLSYGPVRGQRTDRLKGKSVVCHLEMAPTEIGMPSRSSRRLAPPAFATLRRGSLPSLRERRLVGLGRFELPTSRLSSARSNQLSYKPMPGIGDQQTAIGSFQNWNSPIADP